MCASAENCTSSKLRGVAVLSIESPSYLISWQPPANATTAVSSRLPAFPGSGNGLFQVPYPTSAHFGGVHGVPRAPPLAARKAFAALVANTALDWKPRGAGSAMNGGDRRTAFNTSRAPGMRSSSIGRGPLRELLYAECLNAPAGECLSRGGHRGGSMIWNTNNLTFASYASAVFCLQPWGDSATRKGFWDAIMAGCINVIFDDAGYNETDAWFGNHRQWTVRVPLAELAPGGRGALGFLHAIPQSEIAQKHAGVMAIRRKIQYSIEAGADDDTDGVDVIVTQVAQHFRRLRSKGDLPRKYSGESSCKNIIGHICRQVRWMGK